MQQYKATEYNAMDGNIIEHRIILNITVLRYNRMLNIVCVHDVIMVVTIYVCINIYACIHTYTHTCTYTSAYT